MLLRRQAQPEDGPNKKGDAVVMLLWTWDGDIVVPQLSNVRLTVMSPATFSHKLLRPWVG